MRMSEEERQEILRLHSQGLGRTLISRRVRWGETTIACVIKQAGAKQLKQPRGEAHYCAKLNPQKVRAIRESKLSAPKIGPLYGVSEHVVRDLRNRRTWKHVK
jgi:hypothetical protein